MESFALERIYRFTDIIVRTAYINILVIVFSLLGLIVFGFFPAIIAAFSIFRKWFTGYSDISITRNFWRVYKREFVRSNLVGFIIVLVGGLLYINMSIAEVIQHDGIRLTYYPLLLVNILFLGMLIYLLPMYVHFDMKLVELFKNAFLCMFAMPLLTIVLVVTIVMLYFLFTIIPGLLPFFGFSLFILVMMKGALISFERMLGFSEIAKD
ncbi:YesL family protein [Gracilibacillus kekensis]|uniref:Uncharacterized membrane protein YesL n=1 Tax=Gracilibacillus kekensis TaxID=1027249 RepID=A0A1M7JJ44_9BACI|nr:DUF624 domain-containing protein [Gracilibacillus kekensis]SHM53082.1 Uncharacterized membrane protein YesL [Gracilibacillus kekensis]